MKKYLNQLIEEFHKATFNIKPPSEIWDSVDLNDEGEVEDMAYAEQFIYGTPQKLSDIIGIEKSKFPSDQKLTNEQVELLVTEMIRLLHFFNFIPGFPEKVPARTKYRMLVEKWESEQVSVSFGEVEIEFCDYDESKCPFPGYCSICREAREEKDDFISNPKQEKLEIDDFFPNPGQVESILSLKKNEKIKEILSDNSKKYITGIYNYCDRWCEHCKFTNRCSNFCINAEIEKNRSEGDKVNLWKELNDIFKANFSMIREIENELDIDPEDKCENTFDIGKDNSDVINHPLMVISKEYSLNVVNWLEKNLEFFTTISCCESPHSGNNNEKLNDAVEIIQWYSIFISAKINRALSGLGEKYDEPGLQNDTDGSAKIALIAIEKSLSAFETVYQSLNDMEDDALLYLSRLSKIEALTKKTFPKAEKFKRPGFDD